MHGIVIANTMQNSHVLLFQTRSVTLMAMLANSAVTMN